MEHAEWWCFWGLRAIYHKCAQPPLFHFCLAAPSVCELASGEHRATVGDHRLPLRAGLDGSHFHLRPGNRWPFDRGHLHAVLPVQLPSRVPSLSLLEVSIDSGSGEYTEAKSSLTRMNPDCFSMWCSLVFHVPCVFYCLVSVCLCCSAVVKPWTCSHLLWMAISSRHFVIGAVLFISEVSTDAV